MENTAHNDKGSNALHKQQPRIPRSMAPSPAWHRRQWQQQPPKQDVRPSPKSPLAQDTCAGKGGPTK